MIFIVFIIIDIVLLQFSQCINLSRKLKFKIIKRKIDPKSVKPFRICYLIKYWKENTTYASSFKIHINFILQEFIKNVIYA